MNGRFRRSTDMTLPASTSVPNRSACARISTMRSGPMMPSRNPGQFSTIVVSISCPPASSPSIRRGLRLARAVHNAAVNPAGPDPMIATLRSAIAPARVTHVRGACRSFSRCLPSVPDRRAYPRAVRS